MWNDGNRCRVNPISVNSFILSTRDAMWIPSAFCRRRRSMRRFGGWLDGIRKEQHHRAGHGATRPGGRHAPKRHEDEQHVRGAAGVGGMHDLLWRERDVMDSPSLHTVSSMPFNFRPRTACPIWILCTSSTPSAGRTPTPTISTPSSRCCAPSTGTT